MLGAITGDIIGSRFEFHNHRSKSFTLFEDSCSFTDDSVMSLAVCEALMNSQKDFSDLPAQTVRYMHEIGRPYPHCGYGGRFYHWLYQDNPTPYNSYGNGAAMRVSGCAYEADSLEQVKALSAAVTAVTHNHPEGLKGAEATAVAVYMARTGSRMADIRECITRDYYPIDFTLDSIRKDYRFNETCQGSVPQAMEAFFESSDFEDTIRNAVSIGGDSDTIAAIAGAVAEAYYGIPDRIRRTATTFLDDRLMSILQRFEQAYPPHIIRSRPEL